MQPSRVLYRGPLAAGAVAMLLGIGLPFPANADGAKGPRPTNPVWQEECGSCHIAYPPRMLPAEAWRWLMGSLDDHFGSDASIDPTRAAVIESFLVGNARRSKTDPGSDPGAVPLRISEMKWFRSEHRKIPAAKWQSPEIHSAANCGACHRSADQGKFGEHEIKVP